MKLKLNSLSTGALCILMTVLLSFNAIGQKRILCLSWNVESGENDRDTIAKRLANFEGYDIFGLTEVNSSNAEFYAEAASIGEGADGSNSPDFDYVMGTTGGNDRMVIIWDNKRFEKLGDAEELNNLSEGGHRAPLLCRFKLRGSDIEFIFMVNHLARGNQNLRNRQAEGLAEWANNQDVPVIAVGDYNFDYDIDDGVGNTGFNNMLEGGHWTWLKPGRLFQTQLSDRYYSVLDFVFTANMTDKWEGSSSIILSHPSIDNDAESDHRPLDAHFYINE